MAAGSGARPSGRRDSPSPVSSAPLRARLLCAAPRSPLLRRSAPVSSAPLRARLRCAAQRQPPLNPASLSSAVPLIERAFNRLFWLVTASFSRLSARSIGEQRSQPDLPAPVEASPAVSPPVALPSPRRLPSCRLRACGSVRLLPWCIVVAAWTWGRGSFFPPGVCILYMYSSGGTRR